MPILMSKDKPIELMNIEIINNLMDDIMNIYSYNNEYMTKSECKKILNVIFEGLFDEKLKNKNFEYIFNMLSSNNVIKKSNLEPIIKALYVCFDVNYITNSSNFNDKVCIKIGKHLLPNSYYIKKD